MAIAIIGVTSFARAQSDQALTLQDYAERIVLFLEKGEFDEAIALADEAIARYPDNQDMAQLRDQISQLKAIADFASASDSSEVHDGMEIPIEGRKAEEANLPELEIELIPSQEPISMGVNWNLNAIIKNTSDKPIWIADFSSLLFLPSNFAPEIEQRVASRGAVIPKVLGEHFQYLQIPPRCKIAIYWPLRWESTLKSSGSGEAESEEGRTELLNQLLQFALIARSNDSAATESMSAQLAKFNQPASGAAKSVGKLTELLAREKIDQALYKVVVQLWEWLRTTYLRATKFTPGKYQATATVHYWTRPPEGASRRITRAEYDMGTVGVDESAFPEDEYHQVAVKTLDIEVSHDPYVIIAGGTIGGFLGFCVLLLYTFTSVHVPRRALKGANIPWSRRLKVAAFYISHLGLALLLGGITTILLWRIRDTSFVVNISVKDFWGAITIGIVTELVGYRGLAKIVGVEIQKGLVPPPPE